ncbi:MAG TPA: phosphopantothenoylcysteine decarboxylase [Chthoniobacteraceae bacterium]
MVTCGPSYEPIDEVRRITNFSTGELGVLLTNRLAQAGFEVICFKGVGATTQERVTDARVVPFGTNENLRTALTSLQHRGEVAAVFHAAALSDYRVRRVQSSDGHELAGLKIPSREGGLTLTLEPATKLIPELRPLFPNSRIVGWKYELQGNRADSLLAAAHQLEESRTDACVINGAAYGSGFGFYQPGQSLLHLTDKATLCEHLAEWVARFL